MPSRPRPSFVSHLLPGSLALCGLAIACAVQGEERRSLEPMVVTGSYNPSDTFDLPFSVDSIERRQIADGQLGINLSEVLPRVPGLVMQNRQNYAQDLQISSRGYGARSAFGIRGLKLLAAGIPCASLEAWLGQPRPVVRCMPNTPALLRQGASGLYANAQVSAAQREQAGQLLSAVGIALWLDDEAQIDAVTAVSGSGPAYFFLLMQAMTNAGEKLGLSRETASRLTLQTALGAAQMALSSEVEPAELRRRVTSPNGTTEAAIKSFQANGFEALVEQALNAASQRSAELAEQLGQ